MGLMSTSPSWPRRIAQRAPKFTRKLVRSSLGGDVYAFCEMFGRASLLRGFREPSGDLSPGMIGFDACESLLAHLRDKRTLAEKYSAVGKCGIGQRVLASVL